MPTSRVKARSSVDLLRPVWRQSWSRLIRWAKCSWIKIRAAAASARQGSGAGAEAAGSSRPERNSSQRQHGLNGDVGAAVVQRPLLLGAGVALPGTQQHEAAGTEGPRLSPAGKLPDAALHQPQHVVTVEVGGEGLG